MFRWASYQRKASHQPPRINAVVYSEKLGLKGLVDNFWATVSVPYIVGYEVHVKKVLEDDWRDLFIPEAQIQNPSLFKRWLSLTHLRPRWKVCS